MKIEKIDLRGITRDSDKVVTKVMLERAPDDWEIRDWLIFGQAQLNIRDDGNALLSAYMKDGVTDFEHDSAYSLRLPLIGVTLRNIWYHATWLNAWINPNDITEFCVPSTGYNPAEHEDSYICEDCDKPHIILPEGFYVPPRDNELFEKVRGRKVLIIIDTVDTE